MISATGRENADASVGIDSPAAVVNPDSNQYQQYTRSFDYDTDGNPIKISHQGATNYVRNITASDHFDVAGNQQTLSTGQTLTWGGRNQLSRPTTIARSGTDDDHERYLYDTSRQRMRSRINRCDTV
ncbi:MAG: hypothetical protein AAFP10_07630 [Pseudomonadota bacterium]